MKTRLIIGVVVAGVLTALFFAYSSRAALRVPMAARRATAPAVTSPPPAPSASPASSLRSRAAVKQAPSLLQMDFRLPTHIAVMGPLVHVAYLVPSDKAIRADYKEGVEKAIKELQRWYRVQMGGTKTFKLNTPVVTVFKTSHPASWYSSNPNGDFTVSFWNNVVGEGFRATGGKFNDPNYRWVYYIDADPVCGQIGGAGTSGVTALPANDLRGLVGEQNIPPCANESPDYGGVCRWIGGLGHELGHAFGLPHPAQCESGNMKAGSCPSDALMWLGYITYPRAYLLEENKTLLSRSGFFSQVFSTPSAPLCGQ